MKFKHYLTASHFLVIVLFLLCVQLGVRGGLKYNKQMIAKEYERVEATLNQYEDVAGILLGQQDGERGRIVEGLGLPEGIDIAIYTAMGEVLYASDDTAHILDIEDLYQGLYEIGLSPETYFLKKPIIEEENLIGFYEIRMQREGIQEIIKRNVMSVILLICGAGLLIYLFVIKGVYAHLKKSLSEVSGSMNAYAKGDKDVHIEYSVDDELGELCTGFNIMKDKIEERKNAVWEEHRAKDYMIATISHDLKTPLTSIRAYAEMLTLTQNLDYAKKKAYLEIILNKCDYMRDMLDDLLTYNILSMNDELCLVEVEGEEFCEMLYSGVEVPCRRKGIALKVEIDVVGDYKVDVKYMTRVVDNLVSNAIRHTESGKRIWLGAFSQIDHVPLWVDDEVMNVIRKYDQSGQGLLLVVKNEGKSISNEEQSYLFTPFYQGDEARSKKEHKGVGLGLSIAKMIIEKHQGDIWMVPVEGEGNIIFCYLPNKEMIG